MISKKPFFIRAIYDWIHVGGFTPYLVVNANLDGVKVPRSKVDPQGQIVLNISMHAVRDLVLENSYVSFETSFNNLPTSVLVPMKAIKGLVAQEHGDGMWFSEEDEGDDPPPHRSGPDLSTTKKPVLRVIK